MTVLLYANTDTSAPFLSGQVGSMIALLDAVLVNGYGTKAAAGWTKAFTGSNLAVYRNNSALSGSTGMYLQVDDTNALYSIVKAYKTMSDINTGTDVIPGTNPTFTNTSIYWHKSYTSDSTARPWGIIADALTFYMNISSTGTVPSTSGSYNSYYGAGDFTSFVPGNSYNYFLCGSVTTSYTDQVYQITNSQGTYSCCQIGRAQDLVANKTSKAWIPIFGLGVDSGNTGQLQDSSYTGLRFYYPGYLIENTVLTSITGQLRGVYGLGGRNTGGWLANMGKLPDDPTGPDMIQFLGAGSADSMYVRLGNWP